MQKSACKLHQSVVKANKINSIRQTSYHIEKNTHQQRWLFNVNIRPSGFEKKITQLLLSGCVSWVSAWNSLFFSSDDVSHRNPNNPNQPDRYSILFSPRIWWLQQLMDRKRKDRCVESLVSCPRFMCLGPRWLENQFLRENSMIWMRKSQNPS